MTSWWNKNVESRMDDFKEWIGDYNQPSKVYCRSHVTKKKYKTLIDCGCGLATDFYGFKAADNFEIEYTGLDSCKFLVDLNRNNGISMIESELEIDLPILDSLYDCVYCREVLEHLSAYEKTVSELIRIGSKEVMIVFFIKPTENVEDEINYWQEEDLYHNKYSKSKLEQFILANPKVEKIEWVDVSDIPYFVRPRKVEVVPTEVEEITQDESNIPVEPTEPTEPTESVELVKTEEPAEPAELPTGEKTVLHIFLKQV